jgi:hypothetical protein
MKVWLYCFAEKKSLTLHAAIRAAHKRHSMKIETHSE